MTLFLAMVHHPSDTELVDRFKRGDRSAYAEIVRRYQNKVYSLTFRWMRNEQVAREVSQDVFLALYKSLENFRGDARLSTWIHRVAVNHCKNRKLYRKRRHVDKHESLEGRNRPDDDGPVRQFADPGPGADSRRHRTEAEELLHAALEEMDEEQRAILVLRDLQDLDYEEIANLLGVARGTVKSRLHRARATLAKVLARRIDLRDVI